ncbi:hypothetical protein PUN28_010922 [Cardiocondyla obscurior]|uniref:Uncharacterized protein n=1 Tax=Cardiocondyla obscurior TaxID=286306 RepID=A0AAW2FPA2_9HYME
MTLMSDAYRANRIFLSSRRFRFAFLSLSLSSVFFSLYLLVPFPPSTSAETDLSPTLMAIPIVPHAYYNRKKDQRYSSDSHPRLPMAIDANERRDSDLEWNHFSSGRRTDAAGCKEK